ncbi:hypothetical protein D918_06645 [Trichuris suis]|nr:hypothetical protein D918_06645 [Trichuris suis]
MNFISDDSIMETGDKVVRKSHLLAEGTIKIFRPAARGHETSMQFANYLRRMADSCDFEDAALVVEFVNGVRNWAVKANLTVKGKDLRLTTL